MKDTICSPILKNSVISIFPNSCLRWFMKNLTFANLSFLSLVVQLYVQLTYVMFNFFMFNLCSTFKYNFMFSHLYRFMIEPPFNLTHRLFIQMNIKIIVSECLKFFFTDICVPTTACLHTCSAL